MDLDLARVYKSNELSEVLDFVVHDADDKFGIGDNVLGFLGFFLIVGVLPIFLMLKNQLVQTSEEERFDMKCLFLNCFLYSSLHVFSTFEKNNYNSSVNS